MTSKFPYLGAGLGLRRCHYSDIINGKSKIAKWFEAISENFLPPFDWDAGNALRVLLKVREHYPIVLHGVSLNIGGTDPLSKTHLRKLKQLTEQVQPAWVSDHLCWTGVKGISGHDLFPLPYTREAVDHVVRRVLQVQETLQRPLMLENVSSYILFSHSEMTEAEFLREIVSRTGAVLLLDLNNVWVSSTNHGLDPKTYLKTIPLEKVKQVHLAGPTKHKELLFDTHSTPVKKPVWELYKLLIASQGPISTLLERDEDIPPLETLEKELKIAQDILNAAHQPPSTKKVRASHESPYTLSSTI